MNAKLTLKLDDQSIRRAKEYAWKNQSSLSSLVQKFFDSLTSRSSGQERRPSALVASLAGVLKKSRVDFKDEYADYLSRKYR
jgi:hypothetical protein